MRFYSRALLVAWLAAASATGGTLPQDPDVPASNKPRMFAMPPDGPEDGQGGAVPAELKIGPELLTELDQPNVHTTIMSSQIGENDLEPVSSPRTYPASAVVFIRTDIEDCTGWLYGRNIVATAAHCLYHRGLNQWAKRADVYVGLQASGAAFKCSSDDFFATEGFTRHHREDSDYGALRLDCNAGDTVGYFGLGGSPPTPFSAHIMGYLGKVKYAQTAAIATSAGQQFFYPHDTLPGMSGSPLFRTSGSCAACAVALHAMGIHGAKPHSDLNHGTRMTPAVIKMLRIWKATP